jgi:hypothetical protein
MLRVFGPLLLLLSFAQASPKPSIDNFLLTLSRDYGKAQFRQCRLKIVVYQSRGGANLWCDYGASLDGKGRRIPALTARQELAADETQRLIATVRSARLFDGDHIGGDGTASDGMFETLKLQNESDGQAVVLVTSYNSTFAREGPRKQLLSMLKDIEQQLLKKAGA